MGVLENEDAGRVDGHSEVIDTDEDCEGNVHEVPKEPCCTRHHKGEDDEPRPLPEPIVDEFDWNIAVRTKQTNTIVGPSCIRLLPVAAIPLETLKWIVLLILVNADSLTLGLEIVHAEVVNRRTLVLIRERTAVAARSTGDSTAAGEVLVDVAAADNHFVFLGRDLGSQSQHCK